MIQISEADAKNLQEMNEAFKRAYDYFAKNLPADPELAALVLEEAWKRFQKKEKSKNGRKGERVTARYIDADKLLSDFERLEQEAFEECQKAEVGTENYKRWSIILNERTSYKYDLMDAPTEDVAPTKYGEWIGTEFDGYADGNPVYDSWACSVCRAEVESEGEPPKFRYCPNCGAKMREEQDWSSPQPEQFNPCTICQEFDCTGCEFRRT